MSPSKKKTPPCGPGSDSGLGSDDEAVTTTSSNSSSFVMTEELARIAKEELGEDMEVSMQCSVDLR